MTLRISLMRWVATLVGIQMLCGILWVLGPMQPQLEPWQTRAMGIMALVLLWAAGNLVLDLRSTQRDGALIKGAVGGEAGAIGAKLAEALTAMRKAKGRNFRLYEQPWYAIIGPPGAGKTTALLNAGLQFPLAEQIGAGAVSGVGGTRLCDWWFTDDAVLIDTAGRYTTQDSDKAADSAGWEAFLGLLRRTRPRLPLNGVIVAIAVGDVAGDPAQLALHARAIRARIDELEARLGVRLPVYTLFTKADLLAGFSEFFDDLDAAGRAQAWGATFPLQGTPDAGAALRPLLERVDRLVFKRLDEEANADRRALIAGFPAQFAAVLPALQGFVAAAFGAEGGKAPMLRGVFLTSGTQEGTPIDRLLGAMSRSFGLDQRRAAPLRPQAGRAYFLAAVLRDVVFTEAMLAGHRPGAATRRRVVRLVGFTLCLVLAAGGAGAVWVQRSGPQSVVSQAQEDVAAHQAMAAKLPLAPVADDDMVRLLPWLDALVPPELARQPDSLGLSQDDKVAAAYREQYRHALQFALLPRLVWRVESQMRGLLDEPDALYEATRIYLMLGGVGPLDPALVQDWFTRDWASLLPGDESAGQRAALGRHLAALLVDPLPTVPLDGPLVVRARTAIGRIPLAARAWSRLKVQAASRNPAPWRPSEALGAAGVRVFVRLSGRGLEDPIPGLYTVDGFRNAVLPTLPHVADEAANESWVLGETIDANDPRRRTLQADILTIYAGEYSAAWDAVLGDLDPAPLRSLTQAAQDLYILSSSHSPMRALLQSAVAQLAPGAATQTPALAPIDQHFLALRGVFGTGGAAPIDLVLRPLGDLQQQLAKQAASTTKQAPPNAADDPAAALRAEAIRQPQPLARWMVAFATAGASLRDGGPRGAIISAWNAPGGPGALCPGVIGNHFPFVAAAAADASLDDVSRLFGPGAAMDAFFNTRLKPYVDMGAKPWKLQAVDGVNAPLTAGDLAQFQRAAAIRDLLFPEKSTQPLVRFELTADRLDAGTTSATLDLGTATINAAKDAASRPTAVTWPGKARAGVAHLTLGGDPVYQVDTTGPWALFRLAAAGKAVTNGDRTTLTFSGNNHAVRFEIRATPNPFASTILTEFRCPAIQ